MDACHDEVVTADRYRSECGTRYEFRGTYRGTMPGEDEIGGQDPVSSAILDVMWFTSCSENAEFFADGEIQCADVVLHDPIVVMPHDAPASGPGPYVRGLSEEMRGRYDGVLFLDILDGTHVSDVVVVFPREGSIRHAVAIVGRKTYDDDGVATYVGTGW